MPAIRDFSYNYTTSTSGTTIVVDVPYTVTGDLLICILGADTGTGARTWSSTGWTSYTVQSNTTETRIMYRISTGASEPESYTFTASATETFNGIMVSIQDVDTTTPFAAVSKVNRAANNTAYPTISTTRDNTLLLFIEGHGSTAVIPCAIEGPCQFLFQMDGSAHADAISWGFQPFAGTTPNNVISSVSGTTYNGPLITLGINPPSGGAQLIPTYCTDDASLYLDPMHGTTAFRGNAAPAASAATYFTTTVGGKTVANAAISAQTDYGINSYRSCSKQTSSTNRTWLGIAINFASAKTTIAGKNILIHIVPYLPTDIQTLEAIGLQRGVAVGLYSSIGNNKVWHIHGSGTPFGVKMIPAVVNTSNTSGLIGTQGTLDSNSIAGVGMFASGFVASADMVWTMIWALDTTTVCGGNSNTPITIPGIVNAIANGHERMSALQQGSSQMLSLQPFQLGNGGTNPVYLNLSASAIEFPQQYDVNSKQVFYNSVDNVAGVTFYPGSSDYFNLSSSVWSSASKFHWRWHASSNGAASINTEGMQVINAGDVVLQAAIPMSEVSFTNCTSITQNGCTMTSCPVSDSKVISATLADMDNISYCSFESSGIGHAIEVSGSASTITFTGNTFTGYAATNGSTGNEAIYVNIASGTVTLNISGGGSTPSIRTAGATVVVNNSITLQLTGLVSGSDIVILNAGTETERVNVDANVGSTYDYSFTTGGNVDICVYKQGYIPNTTRNYTLPASNGSLPIKQVADRNFSNP